jgi:oxygen-dependent protoporphyrinogen oxidase
MLKARSGLSVALLFGLVAGCSAGDPTGETEEGLLLATKSTRIAVVGAGPSGLMAAYTLKQQGYTNVTVFEQNNRVGGKVNSFHSGANISELGAVFASPDYTLVLGLADKYHIPYTAYTLGQAILDEHGQKQTFESFLTSRYSLVQILGATVSYAAALTLFSGINRDGFALQAPDLYLPMGQFAQKYGFAPIAELVKSIMIGFGYGYYETTPALYFMKLMGWLVKIGGPMGLTPATYYTFPTGFQSIWEAVAAELNVKLNSQVTNIVRRGVFAPSRVQIAINGGALQDFDAVIISAPLNKVSNFMTLTAEETQLFSQVQIERYFVSLFAAGGLTPEEALFFHGNATPSQINHVNVWANRDHTSPVFVGYQIADFTTPAAQITNILAQDVAGQGGGFGGLLLRQEWPDYFPHVNTQSLQQGFYERMELLQGKNNVFYVGGTMSFETVEHSARYAKSLVQKNFPTPLF